MAVERRTFTKYLPFLSRYLPFTQELVVERRSLQLASMVVEVQEQIGHLNPKQNEARFFYPE